MEAGGAQQQCEGRHDLQISSVHSISSNVRNTLVVRGVCLVVYPVGVTFFLTQISVHGFNQVSNSAIMSCPNYIRECGLRLQMSYFDRIEGIYVDSEFTVIQQY